MTSARELVPRSGDRARASGWLVSDGTEQWFEMTYPSFFGRSRSTGPGKYPEWRKRRRHVSDGGARPDPPPAPGVPVRHKPRVLVEGADLDRVRARDEVDGVVRGLATLHGVWLGDRLRVDEQDPDTRKAPVGPRRREPPCPPPPGGWPHVRTEHHDRQMENIRFEAGDLVARGLIASRVQFRPSEDQVVLVVTTYDVAAVEARLRPQLGDRLCVIASRWTREQIDHIKQTLHLQYDHWHLRRWAVGADEQAQVEFRVAPLMVTDEIADWADTQPAKLITWNPAVARKTANSAP